MRQIVSSSSALGERITLHAPYLSTEAVGSDAFSLRSSETRAASDPAVAVAGVESRVW
jgi:hypothetical protein